MIRGLQEKIDKSKETLKLASEMSFYYYHNKLILGYSGGKDSDVMLHLAYSCLNPSDFEVVNNHTTVDFPETVYHIREVFKDYEGKGVKCTVNYAKYPDGTPITMWNLIEKNRTPPTQVMRFCCRTLKERSIPNRFIATGVRRSEGTKRKQRKDFEVRAQKKEDAKRFDISHIKEVFDDAKRVQKEIGGGANEVNSYDCTFIKQAKENADLIVNPIIDWTDNDIWTYVNDNQIKMNPLYKCGFPRVGCCSCPMGGTKGMLRDLNFAPKYRDAYIRAFERMLKIRKENGLKTFGWESGEDVLNWWTREFANECSGQIYLSDFIKKE